MRFASAVFGDDGEDHFARMKVLKPGRAGNQLAIRGKNRRNANEILSSDPGVAQREFERSEALAMFAHAFGKEDPLRDHVFAQFICLHENEKDDGKRKSNIAICKRRMKNRVTRKKAGGIKPSAFRELP